MTITVSGDKWRVPGFVQVAGVAGWDLMRVSSCGMGTARARGTGLNKCRFTRTGLSALLSTTVVAGANACSGRASTTGEPGNSPKQPKNNAQNVKGAEHELRKIKPNSGTFFNGAEKLPIPRGRRFQVAGVPPSLRCGVGGEKRQRTGAVQDASRRRGVAIKDAAVDGAAAGRPIQADSNQFRVVGDVGSPPGRIPTATNDKPGDK